MPFDSRCSAPFLPTSSDGYVRTKYLIFRGCREFVHKGLFIRKPVTRLSRQIFGKGNTPLHYERVGCAPLP